MPHNDLTRARRKLAQLKRRTRVIEAAALWSLQPYYFICPDCGPHVRADEDWCCSACGRDCDTHTHTFREMQERNRMARELASEIRAQELECRRLALTGPYHVSESTRGQLAGRWCAARPAKSIMDLHHRWFHGRNAKARAVAWAERMNRKAGVR